MSLGPWLRSPRRPLAAFLAITLTLAGALGWVSWRVLQQDTRQRRQEHLLQAADLAAATLSAKMAEVTQQIDSLANLEPAAFERTAARYAATLEDDGLVIEMTEGGVEAFPRQRLLYVPATPISAESTDATFEVGESLEFRKKDYTGAADVYRHLAVSRDTATRAGALLRLARVLRVAGQTEAALIVYDELGTLDVSLAGGVPASLVARRGRCAALQESHRSEPLAREASGLEQDLMHGQWQLSRAVYLSYTEEAAHWLPSTAPPPSDERLPAQIAIAEGVAALWNEWRRDEGPAADRTLWIGDRPLLTVTRADSRRAVALVAGPRTFDRLIASVGPMALRHGVQIALTDADRPVMGHVPGLDVDRTVRGPAETHLPWTLYAAAAPGTSVDVDGSSRWSLTLATVTIVGVLVLVGSYFTARATARELEVARLQSNFVAAVSHEFRTPLTSLRQLSELLIENRVKGDEQRAEYYRRIDRESGRLQRLVEDLLDFGRMEAGVREYRMELLDPEPLIRRTVDEFGPQATERGFLIDVTVAGPIPPIRADREALSRAVWNLLDNAVKYSPGRDAIFVTAGGSIDGVTIAVRDDGIGIAADRQRDIFDKFVRVSSEHGGVPGAGLGLAIVDQIVRAHGGRVRLESKAGRGSTFTIELPATPRLRAQEDAGVSRII